MITAITKTIVTNNSRYNVLENTFAWTSTSCTHCCLRGKRVCKTSLHTYVDKVSSTWSISMYDVVLKLETLCVRLRVERPEGGISPFKYAMICHSILRKFNMPRISNRPKDHIIQLNGSYAKHCNALLGCIRVHLRVPWPMEGPQEGSEGWFEVSYPKTHEKKAQSRQTKVLHLPW